MAHEAELTQALHALMPRHFPATLAFDASRHWWLTPGVPGLDLTTTPASEDVWRAAVTLLATAQRKALESRRVATALAHRAFGPVQLAAIATRVARMLAQGPFRADWPKERIDALSHRLRLAIDRLLAYDLPRTWTPAEFVGLNIFNDGGRVWFIGVEDSYVAPPTLAVARFFHDLRFRVHTPHTIVEHLSDAYVEAWRDRIPESVLRGALADSTACGLLFTFRAHLDCHARHHGLWSSERDALPVTMDLHEEAHRLAASVMPKTRTAGSVP